MYCKILKSTTGGVNEWMAVSVQSWMHEMSIRSVERGI